MMKRIGQWVLVFSALAGLCVLLSAVASSEERSIALYVTDALTFPSRSVQLQARLTEHRPEGDQGIPEEPVEFFLQGRALGKVTTDSQGWARLEFEPKMRGNLELRVRWATAAKAEVVEGRGVVLSWERRRPILLIDLAVLVEGELETEPPPPELFPDPGLILGEPQAAAPAELSKLSKFYYNLVYVDQTGRGRLEAIQSWLRKQKFPPGMIKILPQTETSLPDLLLALKEEGWENISGGIGQTADFAETLVKNRLQTIILPRPDSDERFPRRAIILNDWSRVRRHL
ncbi:MAG: hypothetical protein JSU60_05420 [Nitrospirota bacterium]|nr:MAG: hypothetical protein JSU60_05420 [Nitrospirota bacterium]